MKCVVLSICRPAVYARGMNVLDFVCCKFIMPLGKIME